MHIITGIFQIYGTRAPAVMQKDFLGMRHSLLSQFFFFYYFFAWPASLYCEEVCARVCVHVCVCVYIYICVCVCVCVYIYICIPDCLEIVMNYRCYQIILWVKYLNTNQEQYKVLTGYLSLGSLSSSDCANTWHWTKRITVVSSNQKVVAAPVTSTFSSL
jgi:hypothetical protein